MYDGKAVYRVFTGPFTCEWRAYYAGAPFDYSRSTLIQRVASLTHGTRPFGDSPSWTDAVVKGDAALWPLFKPRPFHPCESDSVKLVYVLREGDGGKLETVTVSNDLNGGAYADGLRRRTDFISWAVDPWTGQTYFDCSDADVAEAVRQWLLAKSAATLYDVETLCANKGVATPEDERTSLLDYLKDERVTPEQLRELERLVMTYRVEQTREEVDQAYTDKPNS